MPDVPVCLGEGRRRLPDGNAKVRYTLLPEFPDITFYIDHLPSRISNEPLEEVRLASPFFLRSVDVPIGVTKGKRVVALRRLGKRIVFALECDLFLVLHLMIAGRLRWRPRGTKPVGKIALATFDFPTGTLLVTEASSKSRASLDVVRGEDGFAPAIGSSPSRCGPVGCSLWPDMRPLRSDAFVSDMMRPSTPVERRHLA